jgi:hypothetical protein
VIQPILDNNVDIFGTAFAVNSKRDVRAADDVNGGAVPLPDELIVKEA